MKEDATKDSYDIKQAVLNESYMMIPDSTKRLNKLLMTWPSFFRNNSSKNK
jgi:hypothetical protein